VRPGNGANASSVISIPFQKDAKNIEMMLEDTRFDEVFGVAQSEWK